MNDKIEFFFSSLELHLKSTLPVKNAFMESIKDTVQVFYEDDAKAEEIRELRQALLRSLNLQSHYAKLLNMYDGGERIGFASIEAWLERIKKIEQA